MKLNLVKASSGVTWVKLGVHAFFRRPLAMIGLFALFMATMSMLSLIPIIGIPLAMTFLPTATLGLMVATRQINQGAFPMPLVLLSALFANARTTRAMYLLGLIYAAGFLLAMGATYLMDGGIFASLYLGSRTPGPELLQSPEFQQAVWTFVGLHLPLSLTVWHAPALVYWHDVPVLKSLFFSLVACWRNFWAFTVYGIVWMLVMVLMVLLVSALSAVAGMGSLANALMFPTLLWLAAMFFCSLYFTFCDCFGEPEATVGLP